jgi:hypothetical protein
LQTPYFCGITPIDEILITSGKAGFGAGRSAGNPTASIRAKVQPAKFAGSPHPTAFGQGQSRPVKPGQALFNYQFSIFNYQFSMAFRKRLFVHLFLVAPAGLFR